MALRPYQEAMDELFETLAKDGAINGVLPSDSNFVADLDKLAWVEAHVPVIGNMTEEEIERMSKTLEHGETLTIAAQKQLLITLQVMRSKSHDFQMGYVAGRAESAKYEKKR